jgi:hypothetical protein
MWKFYSAFTGADSYDEQKGAEIENAYGLIGVTPCALTPEQITTLNQATGGHEDPNTCQSQIDEQTNANKDFYAYEQQIKNLFGSEKLQYLDFSFKMFDVTPAFSYSEFVEWLIFGNLALLLVFEAMRRIFYYVVLGSARPGH